MNDLINILLVDDHPANLDVLVAILDAPDLRLVRAQSAQEALMALLNDDFAVIVLDIQMPVVSGIELAHIIKQRKRSRDIPILFLTAYHVEEQDILRGYGAGAVDYMSKPVNTEILRFKISVFVDLFRKTRALAESNKALSQEMSERERAQDALRVANEELERRVGQRTAELAQAVTNERAARAEAERQSRLKEDFLAVVSHELRTPLNAIYGWTKILARDATNADVLAKGLSVIERNARGQAQLIEDLLDMSSIASGKARLDKREVRVCDVVDAALNAIRPSAETAGVHVDMSWVNAPSLTGDCVVFGDANRLQQVIGNLLSNALKFTPRDGTVAVIGRRAADEVQLVVKDSGEGIAPEFLPHLFDKFRQADGSSTRRHRGLGLGLSIVKNLVELHGGSVRAESEGLGRGATFIVTLPLAIAQDHAVAATPDGNAGGEWSALHASRIDLDGVNVLAVDDEEDAREMIRYLLAELRANVTTAPSARDALTHLRGGGFDLLISDIGMPGDDGYALIRSLRDLESGASRGPGGPQESGASREAATRESGRPRLPAIALTAFARRDDRERSLREGFDEHLSKPVDVRRLMSALARLLGDKVQRADQP